MRTLSRLLWVLLGIGVPALLVWLCFRQIDWHELWQSLRQAQPALVVVACVLAATQPGFTSLEWRMLVPAGSHLPLSMLYRVAAVMLLIQNTLHHFAGQAFVVLQLGVRCGLGKSVALSILATDQLAEGLARVSFWGLLALAIDLPDWAAPAVRSVIVAVVVLYAVLLVAAWTNRERRVEPNPHGLRNRLMAAFARWAHHLHGVRDPRITLAAVALALGKKLFRAAAVYCIQQSVGVELAWYAPLLVVGALDAATMLSVTPGHLGIFEAAGVLIFEFLGLDKTLALTLALLVHLVYIAAAVLPGWIISLVWGGGRIVISDK